MFHKKNNSVTKQKNEGNITVTCRFRPLNDKEKELGESHINFLQDNKTVIISEAHTFTYDYVFGPGAIQKQIYESTALPIVEAVMEGFNGTVFAYGQTSSGKTFTMSGPNIFDEDNKGIIPRMVTTVFNKIFSSDESIEYSVKVGFCEIYNEKIKDLIDTTRKDLVAKEDKNRGIFIAGLSEHYVSSGEELLNFMNIGQQHREVSYTSMNAESSRSHSIFITTIHQKNIKDYSEKTGKLFLVDLAGSERASKTDATGKALEESKNINKSLTNLGIVINKLVDGAVHIPYRNSKLTRVLQDSLGGNSKTALIITCSPSPFNESETIGTLRFGDRVKTIKNKPKVNKEFSIAEMKLLLEIAEGQIRKKDLEIKKLKEIMKKSGLIIPAFSEMEIKDYDKDKEDEEDEDEKENQEDENETIKKFKESLALEYEKNRMFQVKLAELNFSNESYSGTISHLQSKIDELKNSAKDYQELIEKALHINITLEEEIKHFSVENSELKRKITELNYISERKNGSREFTRTVKDYDKEMELFKGFEKRILEAEDLLKAKLSLSEDVTGLREILEKNLIKERDQINEQQISLFLNDYFQNVEDLELQIINLEEKYQDALNALSSGKKKIMNDLEKQEYQLENLTMLYNKLLNEKASFKIDQQLSRTKIMELYEINKEQIEEIITLKANLEELANSYKSSTQRAENAEVPVIRNNIRKTIRGNNNILTKVAANDLKNAEFVKKFINNSNYNDYDNN